MACIILSCRTERITEYYFVSYLYYVLSSLFGVFEIKITESVICEMLGLYQPFILL